MESQIRLDRRSASPCNDRSTSKWAVCLSCVNGSFVVRERDQARQAKCLSLQRQIHFQVGPLFVRCIWKFCCARAGSGSTRKMHLLAVDEPASKCAVCMPSAGRVLQCIARTGSTCELPSLAVPTASKWAVCMPFVGRVLSGTSRIRLDIRVTSPRSANRFQMGRLTCPELEEF